MWFSPSRLAGIVAGLFLLTGTAFAQSCDGANPFIAQKGAINIGDVLIYGPDCNTVQDGGPLNSGFSVISFGADPTGVADSTSAFLAAIAAAQTQASLPVGPHAASVIIPCGNYKIVPGNLTVSVNNIAIVGQDKHCVAINRFSDTGSIITFAKASGVLSHVSMRNITFQDLAAAAGSAGYATCANSPFNIIVDGVNDGLFEHIISAYGCGEIAIRAGINIRLVDTDLQTFPIPGVPGQNGLGTMLYIGSSANTNLAIRYSSGVFIEGPFDIECGSIGAPGQKAAYGIWIDGADGVTGNNGHIQSCVTADMRVSHTSSGGDAYPMGNIQFLEWHWDLTPGSGIIFDGGKQLLNSRFDGRVSAGGVFPANAVPGILITGTGGMNAVEFTVGVDGFGAEGILSNGTNISQVVIRPKYITNNNLVMGSHAGINFSQALLLSITGGTVGGDTLVTPNIALGAGANRVEITGVGINSSAGYGITIAAGASAITISGNDLSNNVSGAVNNLTTGSVIYSGNIGLPDTPLYLTPPSTICGGGNIYAMLVLDVSLISNDAGATCTITLLAAASYQGRILWIKTIQAQTVVSAGSNIVPLIGGAAGTAILAGTAGKWAMLQSDGTNWIILAGN